MDNPVGGVAELVAVEVVDLVDPEVEERLRVVGEAETERSVRHVTLEGRKL